MNKRIEWIDTARGIGILLVVLGHSVTTVVREHSSVAMTIYNAVYLVQVPLLLFVSGMAFDLSYDRYTKQPSKQYVKSKIMRLLFPYVSYSLLVYIIFSVVHLIPKISVILENISYGKMSFARWFINLLIGNNIYSEHLWYLYSLFLLSILSFVCVKFAGKNYKYIILFVTILLWLFFRRSSVYDVVWKTSLRGIWFAFGCLVGAKETYSKRKRNTIFLSTLMALIFYYFILENIKIHIIYNIMYNTVVLLFMFAFVALSQILEGLGDTKLKWIGRNSMCIYIFHQPFWGSGLGVALYGIFKLPIFATIIIAFIACLVMPLLFDIILKFPKFKYLRLLLLGE